jgi:hypothetical protein
MRNTKLLVTMLAAAAILAIGVGNASASRLSLSNSAFRVVFSEPVGEPPPHIVLCAATLEGSFHSRTIIKTVNSLIGFITRAAFKEETCRGGRMRVLRETLPWHIQYEGFTGTLPRIGSILAKVIGMAILTEFSAFPGSSCLIRTTAENPAHVIFPREAGGAISFRWNEERFIPTTGLCPEPLFGLFGTTSLTLLGTSTPVTLTLI